MAKTLAPLGGFIIASAVFLTVASTATATIIASNSRTDISDIGIIRLLRHDQRETLIIANREGVPHVVGAREVAGVEREIRPIPRSVASPPLAHRVVAMTSMVHPSSSGKTIATRPKPRKSAKPPSARIGPTQIAQAHLEPATHSAARATPLADTRTAVQLPPSSKAPLQRPFTLPPTPAHVGLAVATKVSPPNSVDVAVAPLRASASAHDLLPEIAPTGPGPTLSATVAMIPHLSAPGSDLLEIGDGSTYVPTSDVQKPSDDPTPTTIVNRHDPAWMYAHRFETPDPTVAEDVRIPGIPVRSQVASPFDIRSGAFHGVRAVNGYSAVRAEVSIPCGVRHFVTGPGVNEVTGQPGDVDLETGYIYIGGWGAGPRGVAVDAGLQKSSAQAMSDEYAFYFKYASNKPITSARFPCGGPDVILELYPLTDRLLVFTATGVLENGTRSTLTIVQKTDPADGWTPQGGTRSDGIIIKRIVAIAQPASWRQASNRLAATRFISGTYFGVDGPHDRTPRILWKNCEIGSVSPSAHYPEYRAWLPTLNWSPRISGIYLDWPPLGVVHKPNAGCDAIGILLHA